MGLIYLSDCKLTLDAPRQNAAMTIPSYICPSHHLYHRLIPTRFCFHQTTQERPGAKTRGGSTTDFQSDEIESPTRLLCLPFCLLSFLPVCQSFCMSAYLSACLVFPFSLFSPFSLFFSWRFTVRRHPLTPLPGRPWNHDTDSYRYQVNIPIVFYLFLLDIDPIVFPLFLLDIDIYAHGFFLRLESRRFDVLGF